MNTNPLWLIDRQIPNELKTAYKVAVRDKATLSALARVLAALHLLVDEAGFHTELQNCVHNSIANGGSVVDSLREREEDILVQVETAQVAKRVYTKIIAARQTEIQPVLMQCLNEGSQLAEEISVLERKISGFKKQREAAETRLRSAGLTTAQIEQIGVLPSPENLAEWQIELAAKTSRAEQINQFVRSSPDYDVSLLTATQGTES